MKDNDAALKILHISEELDPEYEGTHYISAKIFENMNDSESALKHWKKVLNSDPSNEMAIERIKTLQK